MERLFELFLVGYVQMPWWGYVLITLVYTHITITGVTIYLHRCVTHHALDLHPLLAHFFRLYLWLTTGMTTREWEATHKKHHQKVETPEDPHSPQAQMSAKNITHPAMRLLFMLWFVFWGGVRFYSKWAKENRYTEVIRLGIRSPDDWIERNLYSRHVFLGITLMLITNMLLFGAGVGLIIWGIQMAWIPVFAAGVINGVGHWAGYRNTETRDASRNIFPVGIVIGGEELHNNHHADAGCAKFSRKWFEFDVSWMYICILEFFGLITNVRRPSLKS